MIVQQVVETAFRVNSGQYKAGMDSVIATSQNASAAMEKAQSHISGLGAAFIGLAGITAGALSVKGITDLGSKFEDSKIQIAGFMTAIGKSTDFNDGLEMAAETMRAITVAAASLPGEADDYTRVFKAGMVSVGNASHGTLKDIYTFTNAFTAVSSTLGVDSEQAAADLQRLLQAGKGGAGMDVRTWQQMFNLAKGIPKYASLTAEKFNKMDAGARFKTLEGIMGTMQPMLDAASNSWGAQIGAMKSNVEMLIREGTTPLFEGMRSGLAKFNALFMDSKGNWTEFGNTIKYAGKLISTYIVGAFTKVATAIESVVSKFGGFRGILDSVAKSPVMRTLSGVFDRIGDTASRVVNGGPAGAAVAGGVAGAAVGIAPGLLLPLMGMINWLARGGESVSKTFDNLAGIVDSASRVLAPFTVVVMKVSDVLGDLFTEVMPPLTGAFRAILDPVFSFLEALFLVTAQVVDRLRPAFRELWVATGTLVATYQEFAKSMGGSMESLLPILRVLGDVVVFALSMKIKELIFYLNVFGKVLSWFTSFVPKNATNVSTPKTSVLEDFVHQMDVERAKDAAEDLAKKRARKAGPQTPDGRPHAETYQDFRGSKFDVTQKFAEGFDPDRVAIALAADLGRVGEEKLQSGFEPIFGIR